jgi:transcription elongation factor GreB
VFFGAWVTVEDENGERSTYRIVGSDEIDPNRGFISVDSPLARALLKKTVSEEFIVQLPKGAVEYVVIDVRYAPTTD